MSDPELTPDELKRRYDASVISGSGTFETHGVSKQAALDYLETEEGEKYLDQLREASPHSPLSVLQQRAIDQITSGAELPRLEQISEPLVKIVPSGTSPSPYTPFWAKASDLEAAIAEGRNLSEFFGLPIASESTQYDVYQITPKDTTDVFVSTVAPTSELDGQVTKPGGATQYLTPNRGLFGEPEFVTTVDNRLHLPVAMRLPDADPAADVDDAKVRTRGATIKGAGLVGALYGAYDGEQQIEAAIDTAASTREQWVRGSEEAANVGTRTVVTGTSAVVGAIPGAALGTLTSPVTGPAGPVAGGLIVGTAAAAGAERLYEDSRLQEWSRVLGRSVGELGYDYVSREGRLLRQVNGLKEDLQATTDPAERLRLQADLNAANKAFASEAERNGRYFEGRAHVERAWESIQAAYPNVDKDDITDALSKHIDTGKRPADAARGALSDAVHLKYPRQLPYEPPENYRAMSTASLAEMHRQFLGEVVEGRTDVMALAANTDSHNNIDQGWPRELAEQRQAQRVQERLDELWRDTGHLGAIRQAYVDRGLTPPDMPAELMAEEKRATAGSGPSPSVAGAATDRHAALSPDQQRHLELAREQLGPALSARGHSPEQVERICVAAMAVAQQHAERGPVKGFFLSKDGATVAVVQQSAPMSEMSVEAALQRSGEQHLALARQTAPAQELAAQRQDAPGPVVSGRATA